MADPHPDPGFPIVDFPDLFALLMRSVKDHAILIMDLEGRIRNWNEGAVKVFGYGPEEVSGRKADFLFTPEDAASAVPGMELGRALDEGKCEDERWHVQKGGARFWASGFVYPLRTGKGEAAGFVKILRDFTAQKSKAAALRESERKLEFILENLRDHAIFLIDREGAIASWNKGSERVFGWREDEIVGRPFATIFTPVDVRAKVHEKELAQALATGKGEDERWHRRKDGTTFWASGAVIPVDGEGEPQRFIKILRDATDRKRAEDANRMESIGRLAGGVAHDFNNLLTAILGYSELLSGEVPKGGPQQEWLQEVMTAAKRAAVLTRDLLSFSRQQIIAPEPVDLNEVIRKMEELFRRTLGEDIEVRTSLGPELRKAILDRGQIEQVLVNLALNAREAMPAGGEIFISTANGKPGEKSPVGEPFITLTFRDTGTGMDSETVARVFEPFFSTKARSTGSNGLGLSTAYGIIRQSNGHISVASEPGGGAEFTIHLPAAPEQAERPAGPAQAAVVPPEAEKPRGETVLLVEDEHTVRKLISQLLRNHGYRVLEARDGREGLAAFGEHGARVDFVLSDVVMPHMGGMEMARAIRARESQVPIVFMSGYSEEALTPQGIEEMKAVFLPKPFTLSPLLEKLSEAKRKTQTTLSR